MDISNYLIIIKGEDKTSEILKCNLYNNLYYVTYFGKRVQYKYNAQDVFWLSEPETIDTSKFRILKDGKVFQDVAQILKFNSYIRLIFNKGRAQLYRTSELRVEKNSLGTKNAAKHFSYYKRLADVVSIITEDGFNILAEQYKKISFISENSPLGNFLCGKLTSAKSQGEIIYYPFGCNLSQMLAVNNALSYDFSVIEGPPGTGKTQTILNIIANILMEGKTVAVVSGNNSATANVAEKLQKYGLGYLLATLGNNENKVDFIDKQVLKYPDFSNFNYNESEIEQKKEYIKTLTSDLSEMLTLQNRLAELNKEFNSIQIEIKYFDEYYQDSYDENILSLVKGKLSSQKLLTLWLEIEKYIKSGKEYSLLFKYKHWLISGIKDFSFYNQSADKLIAALQKKYYIEKSKELTKEMDSSQAKLKGYDFNNKLQLLSELSLAVLKSQLFLRCNTKFTRRMFTIDDLWRNSEEFNTEYPVILSTSYALKSSLGKEHIYDYLIVDEASQVDLVTGVLALSCSNKAVIVGDTKQSPNVVTPSNSVIANKINDEMGIPNEYNYVNNSLLSAICLTLPTIPNTLLREHYRCHPKIIEFCNVKFYNNQLITMTKDNKEDNVIKAYITVKGNHERDHVNERQIDEIKQTILPELVKSYSNDEIGIIAPYRKQTEHIGAGKISSYIDVSTVHKFQGREKDAIIITTVDNQIGDFVDNPNMLNVAISRAKKSLSIIVSDNEKNEKTNIGDLIKYIQYNNFDVVKGEVYSIFDMLYKGYQKQRLLYLAKSQKVSEYDSENLMYALIKEILSSEEFSKLDVAVQQPLRMLIKDVHKLNDEEIKYMFRPGTKVDFVIFNRFDKTPVLAIEVDGYSSHKEGSVQATRDIKKNSIFDKYEMDYLRLPTTGSGEKAKIINKLMEIKL